MGFVISLSYKNTWIDLKVGGAYESIVVLLFYRGYLLEFKGGSRK
jgi:hypothetical protein